jgi:phosphosulfolactate phosphohydrolase-like enzyme
LSVAIIIVDVVIRRAVAVIVDVRCTVAIVVDAVARRAITIIVVNGKTPAHWQRQQRHRDEGNNAIATTAKTPAHLQR